ncbi:MAG TPA: 16S rRNA pseudouridine(516) synthase [Clostridiales bacterium]|nr:16S rRNA pseudouridine(516) synthase [Clostridiales bacterium]
MRLDRYLANAGQGSRSKVRELIRQGSVCVDGSVIRDSGHILQEDSSGNPRGMITIGGQTVLLRRQIHLMLHKPAGLVTAMDDPRLPTIAGLIPGRLLSAGLFPVGRLDRDATGLLLLTNDGILGHRLASPRWQVWKTYAVTFSGLPYAEPDRQTFAQGLLLADGQRCRPARLDLAGPQQILLTIHEGKFHQVKRMLLCTGRQVTALHRLSIGPLELDKQLAPGESRELNSEEVRDLYALVGLIPEPPFSGRV